MYKYYIHIKNHSRLHDSVNLISPACSCGKSPYAKLFGSEIYIYLGNPILAKNLCSPNYMWQFSTSIPFKNLTCKL